VRLLICVRAKKKEFINVSHFGSSIHNESGYNKSSLDIMQLGMHIGGELAQC